jgi:hypothetical protein
MSLPKISIRSVSLGCEEESIDPAAAGSHRGSGLPRHAGERTARDVMAEVIGDPDGHDHVDSSAAYIHLAPSLLREEFDAARASPTLA